MDARVRRDYGLTVDPERVIAEGWVGFAPLDAAPEACAFCGEKQAPDRRLMASGDGSVAICEDCVARFAAFFARHVPNGPR
jgi:hypothetical protein